MTEFLHRKPNSNVWYYRRRYPKAVAGKLGKAVFLQSLQTEVKREAQKRARQVSVEFDAMCEGVLQDAEPCETEPHTPAQPKIRTYSNVYSDIAQAKRRGADWALEEQQTNPAGWYKTVMQQRELYARQVRRPWMNPPMLPAVAQAFVCGIDVVLNGETNASLVSNLPQASTPGTARAGCSVFDSWEALQSRALELYGAEVSRGRCSSAQYVLSRLRVQGSPSVENIQEALQAYGRERLQSVQPRTVKGQQDAATSALRKVLPEFKARPIRELRGVMQPRVGDREPMPVCDIWKALQEFSSRRPSPKIRRGYAGGGSQFDDIVVQMLAYTGMRPNELLAARPASLVQSRDIHGITGLCFRITGAKTQSSERDIPLAVEGRTLVPLERLRELLAWLEQNPRPEGSLRTSFGTRFKKATGYTPYQLRHSWKDIAQHTCVDFEIRERLLGHALPGVTAAYGSGVPLRRGFDALLQVKQEITAQGTGTGIVSTVEFSRV